MEDRKRDVSERVVGGGVPAARGVVPEEIVAAGAVVNVTEHLRGLRFPASKDDVRSKARENRADPSALEQIEVLPDRAYRDPGELIAALGDEVRHL